MSQITSPEKNFSQWYLDIVEKAELADYSSVKGAMVIKPYGYAIWENLQKELDTRIKGIGAKNAYFPLFIPEKLLQKEAEHVEGFAPECATVTRVGEKELEEPLVVRPTSEVIIYESFAKWIESHRDVPLCINQWANIVRWEMRTRPFLRTSEFLWQEGHTVHATEKEADEMTMKALEMYTNFDQEFLALPVITGRKSESEKFPGAKYTTTTEALARDGKAIQAGTSHQLGQGFAKSAEIEFVDTDEKKKTPWQTSWGVSTRLIGTIIVVHGDEKGLRLPPKIAPIQVVVVPILRGKDPDASALVLEKAREIVHILSQKGVRIELDDREGKSPGFKFNEWEVKGVPLRMELGPRDLQEEQVVIARRDRGEKTSISVADLESEVPRLLEEIQESLYEQAAEFQRKNTHEVFDYDTFKEIIAERGGFVRALWCGEESCEQQIQSETKATNRCMPFDVDEVKGECICCQKSAKHLAVFAKAY